MVQKLFKRFYCLFSPSKKDLGLIHEDLENLHNQLFYILNTSNKIEVLVDFFKIILPIQENGLIKEAIINLRRKNYGQNNMTIKVLEKIQSHLEKIQNSEFNETEYGEEPTEETIFLGNIFCIPREPARYFLEKRARLKKLDLGYPLPNFKEKGFVSVWYCLNNYQAEVFLKKHKENILIQLSILKESKSF